jgi:hypothetical protein
MRTIALSSLGKKVRSHRDSLKGVWTEEQSIFDRSLSISTVDAVDLNQNNDEKTTVSGRIRMTWFRLIGKQQTALILGHYLTVPSIGRQTRGWVEQTAIALAPLTSRPILVGFSLRAKLLFCQFERLF